MVGYLAFVTAFVAQGPAPALAASAGWGDENNSSPPVDGVQIVAATPSWAPVGAPVFLRASIVNGGPQMVLAPINTSDPIQVAIELTTADGKPVSLTPFGQRELEPVAPEDIARKATGYHRRRYAISGETLDMAEVNLALYYNLSSPGKYLVTVSKRVMLRRGPLRKELELKVVPIQFSIRAAPAGHVE